MGRMWALVLFKLRSRKSQRGAAALEFALVFPVLLLLLVGIVDFGMLSCRMPPARVRGPQR